MTPRHLAATLAVLALVHLSGCSGGSNSGTSAGSPSATTSAASATSSDAIVASQKTSATGTFAFAFAAGSGPPQAVLGRVVGDGPVAGAQVQMVAVPQAQKTGTEYRLVVTLADGTVLITDLAMVAADSEALGGRASDRPSMWVWVTPVSHLASSYRAAHPGTSALQALQRTKRALGIGARESINRPFPSTFLSQFCPRAFFQAAAAAGGVKTLTAQLVAGIDAGQTRTFRQTDPYAAIRIAALAPPAPRTAGKQANADSFGVGLLSNVLGDVITDGIGKLVGYVAGLCGLSNGTNQQLAQISAQLSQVESQLTAVASSLNAIGTSSLASTLATSALSPINTFIEQQVNAVSQTGAYVPYSTSSNTSFLGNASTPTSSGSGFLAQLNASNAFTYADDITGSCLNLSNAGNVVLGLNQSAGEKYGSGGATNSSGAPNPGSPQFSTYTYFYDFRNDTYVLPSIANNADYYVAYLAGAADMIQESYNQDLASGASPATSVAKGQQQINGSPTMSVGGGIDQNGINALAKRMLQQRPLAMLGGQSAVDNVWVAPGQSYANHDGYISGTMWAASGVEINEDGKDSGYNINSVVGGFSTNGWFGWQIPSYAFVQQLAARAAQAASADGVTGNNAVPYGLHKMGLLSDSNYSSSMSNVEIYCNLYQTGGTTESLQVYSSIDNSVGGNGLYLTNNQYDFRPQGSGNVALVLLIRGFPGLPRGDGAYNQDFSPATTAPPPAAVANSATYQKLAQSGLAPYSWESTEALAAGFTPAEVVIGQDPSNPHQLHAYGVWAIDGQSYSQDDLLYVMYADITDSVEWLSSNTAAAEISNFPALSTTVRSPVLSGASMSSSTPPGASGISGTDVVVLNPQGSGGALTGGVIVRAGSVQGTVTGTATGGLPFSDAVSGATLVDATLSAGTVTNGTTYTLTPMDATPTYPTMLTGATLTNAATSGGMLITPQNGSVGLINVHDPTQAVSFIASVMSNASTTTATNAQSSQVSFVTVPGSAAYPTFTIPGNTFSDSPALRFLTLTPNNFTVELSGAGTYDQAFSLSASYTDGTVTDVTGGATFQAFLPSTNGQPVALDPQTNVALFTGNVLQFPATFGYSGDVVVIASYGGLQAVAAFRVLPPVP